MARAGLLAILLGVTLAGRAMAGAAEQAHLDILVDSIRANKKALVAANLTLTDDEASRFWPVYDRYQGELNKVNDRLLKVVQDYTGTFKTMSDDQAMQLAEQYLTVEEDRAKVRRNFLPEIAKALPGRKVVRFYQIENKMDAVMRFDLASEIPVIDQ